MGKTLVNKYINLLFRIAIGVVAIYLIYIKVKTQFEINFNQLVDVNYLLLIIAFLLFTVNWGIEAYKWKYLVSSTIKISLFTSFKIIMTGITIGLITPNRVGEIPARVMLLNDKKQLKNLITFTFIGAFAQGLITVIFGVLALFLTLNYFIQFPFTSIFFLIAIGIVVALTILYFNPKIFKKLGNKITFIKKRLLFDSFNLLLFSELLNILLISALRYLVFSLQYYLILTAFGIGFSSIQDLALIAICFVITSTIPTILISEIGVRGSVALFVFGLISPHALAIVMSSIMLWIINIAIPSLIGIYGLKQLKVLKDI